MSENTDSDDIYINDDKTIYEVLNNRYLVEWQRTSSIENKAVCMIGFIGILLVFSADLIFSHLDSITSNSHMLIFCVFCVVLLMITLYVSMMSLFFGNTSMLVIDTDYIMREYVYTNRPFLQTLCVELNSYISYNNGLNISKNFLLRSSTLMFIVSVVFLFIFAIWCACAQSPDEIDSVLNYSNSVSSNANVQTHLLANNSTLPEYSNRTKYNTLESKVSLNSSSDNSSLAYQPLCNWNLNFRSKNINRNLTLV